MQLAQRVVTQPLSNTTWCAIEGRAGWPGVIGWVIPSRRHSRRDRAGDGRVISSWYSRRPIQRCRGRRCLCAALPCATQVSSEGVEPCPRRPVSSRALLGGVVGLQGGSSAGGAGADPGGDEVLEEVQGLVGGQTLTGGVLPAVRRKRWAAMIRVPVSGVPTPAACMIRQRLKTDGI